MSRTKPAVPPYKPTDPDEEMPVFKPGVAQKPLDKLALEDAQEPQDGSEPELPLGHPEMHDRLQAATATALAELPDPSGKDEIIKWAARIEVLQAYRFDGKLAAAPKWVDRNWLSWDDGLFTATIQREPGPSLNVTRADGTHVGMCLKGDYVCRQNTTVDDPDVPGGLRMLPDHLAVVAAAEFERLFRPVKATPKVDVTEKAQAA